MTVSAPKSRKPSFSWPEDWAGIGGLVIALATSVAGAAATTFGAAVLYGKGKEAASTFLSIVYLCLSNLIFMTGVVALIWIYRNVANQNAKLRVENERYRTSNAADSALNKGISMERMLVAFEHTKFCAELRRAIQREEVAMVKASFESYLSSTLDATSRLFKTYTNDTCAASIKLFCEDKKAEKLDDGDDSTGHSGSVWTLKRDSASTALRAQVDSVIKEYEYDKNAAFMYILDREHEPDYFVSNDLSELERLRRYWNENKKWKNFYNATIVVPIRSPNGRCVGLLCVDNREGGFDDGRCVHILFGIAADLYYSIRTVLAVAGYSNGRTVHA